MAFEFREARREGVGLLIGLAGGTGSGKTYTAMRLAKGIAGDRKFAVIDTEAGRAKHYADLFRFDHGDLRAPFRPGSYLEAIQAADKANYPAIVVDSMSHEHAGDGGVLDWQEDELERLSRGDAAKRESMKMLSWQAPKRDHKRMVYGLLQVRAHLILCFRAEPKIEMVRVNGKTEVREKQGLNVGPGGWTAITDKQLPFELTTSFMLMAAAPGVPLAIKLQEQHKPLFPLDRVIDERSGAAVAAWALGSGAVSLETRTGSSAAWVERIKAARAVPALLDLAAHIRDAKLPEATATLVRLEYDVKLNQLKQAREGAVA